MKSNVKVFMIALASVLVLASSCESKKEDKDNKIDEGTISSDMNEIFNSDEDFDFDVDEMPEGTVADQDMSERDTNSAADAKHKVYDKLVQLVENEPETIVLKNAVPSNQDTVSYYLGLYLGDMIKGSGLSKNSSELNYDVLEKAIRDAINAPYPKSASDEAYKASFEYDPYQTMSYLNNYTIAKQKYAAELNKLVGEKFMELNINNGAVEVTESGLQYVIHKEGEGDKVKMEDSVTIKYEGKLIDGTIFDSNESLTMMAGQFVPGFSEGLCLLAKGGKATLIIPSNLAYGQRGPQQIGPNSTLIFKVEIIDIIKLKVEEQAAE